MIAFAYSFFVDVCIFSFSPIIAWDNNRDLMRTSASLLYDYTKKVTETNPFEYGYSFHVGDITTQNTTLFFCFNSKNFTWYHAF